MPKTLHYNEHSLRFSRELSWLAFNERVLDEAADPSNPTLERVKFLAIVSNNLEEFFRVRVADLRRRRPTEVRDEFPVAVILERIRLRVYAQKMRQAQIFGELCRDMSAHGLHVEDAPSDLAREVFLERVLPNVAPLRIPDGSKLPYIKGSALYMLARHAKSRSLIEFPPTMPRLLIVKTKHVFFVERLLSWYREDLFKHEVLELFAFKVSRDAEIILDEDADDPVAEMETQITNRETGAIVRLEVDSLNLSESVRWLQAEINATPDTLYQLSLPLDLKALIALHNIKRHKKLKYNYPEPRQPKTLPKGLAASQFFKKLEKHDVLLHHPYVSFDPVIDLVRNAAQDPATTKICQTLYRTSGKSPIFEALLSAAQAGKKVTALIEIKARFDEANNIRWARALEKAGARVIYGAHDLKIHAKVTYVERQVGKTTKGCVHLSTGNYHPRTARLYTDLGIITSKPAYTAEAKALFEMMEAYDDSEDLELNGFKSWVVAPDNLHACIIEWINNEARQAQAGLPAGIRAKMNGLVEPDVIDALYRASQAGVKIDLFVRGMCCLRPGVAGLSENIRVRSLVDRYLEHSRLFIFENGGNRQVWLSSADWMPRNFFRRIELAVPITNPKMVDYFANVYWNVYDRDNVRAQECDPHGRYARVATLGEEPFRAQFAFETMDPPEF